MAKSGRFSCGVRLVHQVCGGARARKASDRTQVAYLDPFKRSRAAGGALGFPHGLLHSGNPGLGVHVLLDPGEVGADLAVLKRADLECVVGVGAAGCELGKGRRRHVGCEEANDGIPALDFFLLGLGITAMQFAGFGMLGISEGSLDSADELDADQREAIGNCLGIGFDKQNV